MALISKSFGLLLVLAAFSSIQAATDYEQAGLDAHNSLRAKHKNTGAMTLDDSLSQNAQKCAQYYAKKGQIDHKCPYKNGAGENLAWRGGSMTLASAVKQSTESWYSEISQYNYNNPGYSDATGHFTQVVWKSSVKLGIGAYASNGRTYVVGLYSPPGNMNTRSQFQANVLPKN